MEGSRGPDRQVCPGHVVVDAAYESNNIEVLVRIVLLLCDLACARARAGAGLARDPVGVGSPTLTLFQQILEMFRPLCAQPVGSCQTAVSSADNECVNAVLDEVVSGRPPALELSERFGACCTNERASFADEASDIVPSDADDVPALEAGLAFAFS